MKPSTLALAMIAATLVTATDVAAQDTDAWHTEFGTYMWLTAMEGDAVVRGNPVELDVSFGDSIDALSSLEASFMGHLEFGKGRWTGIVDGFYVGFEEALDLRALDRDAVGEVSMYIAELGAAYEVSADADSSVEVIGGARFLGTEVSFEVEDTGFEREASRDRVQPFLGARGHWAVNDKWETHLRADIGGFSGDDMSWNVVAMLSYAWKEHRAFNVGYRVLSIDYEDDAGDNAYEFDVVNHGPMMGFSYRF